MLDFIDCLRLFSVFQLIALSLFLTFYKKCRTFCNRLLVTLLTANILILLDGMIIKKRLYFIDLNPHLFCLGMPFELIAGPILYFYVQSHMDRAFRPHLKQLIHLIPFAIYGLYLMDRFYFLNVESKVEFILNSEGLYFSHFDHILWPCVILLNFFFYSMLIFHSLKNRLSFLNKKYSKEDLKNKVCFNQSIFILILMWGTHIHYRIIFKSKEYIDLPETLYLFSLYILVNFLFFNGIRHPHIFVKRDIGKRLYKNHSELENPQKHLDRLKIFMNEEKPYLDPSINMERLAEKISIPQRKLSSLLNTYLNKNFFDFINSYRIEESKRLLIQAPEVNKSIAEILYEVGFNSKSTFNTAFKKNTGMTPSEYKRNTFIQ